MLRQFDNMEQQILILLKWYGKIYNRVMKNNITYYWIIKQGELEHRTPKATYSRTSRKGFLKQMTQIERRQARIRHIRERLNAAGTPAETDAGASSPTARYHVGKTQNQPEHIIAFVQKNAGDPAVKVNTYTCETNNSMVNYNF